MNDIFKGINWRRLVILISIFILSFIALVGAIVFYYWSTDYKTSADRKLSSIESQIQIAIQNSNVLYNNMRSLENLYTLGVLGEPLRLEWVKILQAITDEVEIPEVEFTVNPTVSENGTELSSQQEEFVLATPMMLNIEMMHEGDFYRLLTALKNRSRGFFKVNSCEIKRNSNNFGRELVVAQFNALCELTWFNYKDLRQEWFNREV